MNWKAYNNRYKTGGVKVPGGVVSNLPGGAKEFTGNTHEEGGIHLDSKTEVEDGETSGNINGKEYFFSNHLKLNGSTFAELHKRLLSKNATQAEITGLADRQELVSGRSSSSSIQQKVIKAEYGGYRKTKKKYEEGGEQENSTTALSWEEINKIIPYLGVSGDIPKEYMKYLRPEYPGSDKYVFKAEYMRPDMMNPYGGKDDPDKAAQKYIESNTGQFKDGQYFADEKETGNIKLEDLDPEAAEIVRSIAASKNPVAFNDPNFYGNRTQDSLQTFTAQSEDDVNQEIENYNSWYDVPADSNEVVRVGGVRYKKNPKGDGFINMDDSEISFIEPPEEFKEEEVSEKEVINEEENTQTINTETTMADTTEEFDGAKFIRDANLNARKSNAGPIDMSKWALVNVGGEEVYVPYNERFKYSPEKGQKNSDPVKANEEYQKMMATRDKEINTGLGEGAYKDDEGNMYEQDAQGRWRVKYMTDNGFGDGSLEDEWTTLSPDNYPGEMNLTPHKEKKSMLSRLQDVKINKDLTTMAVSAAQLIPAYMAYKDTPDYMDSPGKIPQTKLDRVNYNSDRSTAAADYRALNRGIELTGTGPSEISNKMMAYSKKQEANMNITAQETKVNTDISNREDALNTQTASANIKNNMIVDEFNTAADATTKDRKLEAVQSAVSSLAGMNRDRLQYQASENLTAGISGGTGVMNRFDARMKAMQIAGTTDINDPRYVAAFKSLNNKS